MNPAAPIFGRAGRRLRRAAKREAARLRKHLQPAPTPAPAPAKPQPEPWPLCEDCGVRHDPASLETNRRLAAAGILEVRELGYEDIRFRGDVASIPQEFLFGVGVNEALSDGQWHRVTFEGITVRLVAAAAVGKV